MKILIKQSDDLNVPKQGSNYSAGYDIIAISPPKIVGEFSNSNSENLYNSINYIEYETGLYIAPQRDEYQTEYHVLIFPRSSISKYNLMLANGIGLVDFDYRGQILCRFKYIWQPEDIQLNLTDTHVGQIKSTIHIKPNLNKIYNMGDKIAQLVIQPTVNVNWEIVNALPDTKRGTGGFGSTDAKVIPPQVVSTILNKYTESGGVQTKVPYSELIKNRDS
jgi:dUTP pyrophosphatase